MAFLKRFVDTFKALSPVPNNRGTWFPLVREPYSGAWQNNDEWHRDTVLAFHAVYAAVTLIASDIGKMRIKLTELNRDGIWTETTSPAFSPVLNKPNRYQNHIQFKESWILSKLIHGNTVALKVKDGRGIVTSMFVLDWTRVKVLVSDDGSVFYELNQDNLSGLEQSITVPASEIIHDRMNTLFHPLIGVSPLFACGFSASLGLSLQRNSKHFSDNSSNPGGILTAPGHISPENAAELKAYWNDNFTGTNAGKIAVVGDGLKLQSLRMSSADSQFIEQLRWTAEVVASVFHVPGYKIGIGQSAQTYNNIDALNQQYYSECLQILIESMELSLDTGLGIDTATTVRKMRTELDIEALLRMDTATKTKAMVDQVGGGIRSPNEARRNFDLPPVMGGDTPYLQVQNYSLEALGKRDELGPPVTPGAALPAPEAPAASVEPEMSEDEILRIFKQELA